MNIVGIDFSINSPAVCCYNDGKYTWGSLTRSDRTPESLRKNTKKPFSVLDTESDFELIFLEKKELPEDYTGRERIKIVYFLEIVSDKDLQYKAEIMSMVEGSILVKEGNRFLNGSSNLGSLDGTIAWMKDPNNSSEYVVLQARLQEFGIPLKEFKKVAKASK
jgi:hypothetical protein